MRWILFFGVAFWLGAVRCEAQTPGQLAYDIFDGTNYIEKYVSPVEGKFLAWENGELVTKTAAGGAGGDVFWEDILEVPAVLTGTTASFTTALETKLGTITTGAEVNVNPDWNAGSGDAQILNKPTLGTMAAETASNYLTTAAAASGYQPLAAVLTGTTASFTTALETKLGGIATGAEVNVNADWNAGSGDAQILNKPTLGTLASQNGTITDYATTAAVAAGYQPLAAVLTGTTASFTTVLESKLNGIAAGAEVNVNPDWNAGSGDAQILNKPTLGTMAAETASNYLTTAAAASGYQPLAAVLTGTTASFTTALESKLNGIAAGAEVNVNPDWNAGSGDAQILNKPTLGTMAAETASNYLTTGAAASGYQPLAAVLTGTTASFTTTLETKLNGIEAGADVTDAANVAAAGALMDSDLIDEDDMVSNSATRPPSQQSVKAYVDANVGGGGGGSGTKTIAVFTALEGIPPATNYAIFDTRNSIPVQDFSDSGTNKDLYFVGVIPEAAVLTSGISVIIHWTATSATSGNGRWGAQWEATGTDLDSDSFDTATEVTTATSGTSGIEVTTTITCTSIDSITAGQRYRLKVYRDSSDAADTITGTDLELVSIELRTAN